MNEILNYIQRIYQTFTPTDALEVALIAAVIYLIYRGLRGTRHDMGVVIRGGRITAAGCEFPLPRQSILEAKYGTRHRAAVGLSEETDAVIVVVSEETGNISVAVEGRLETPFTPEELRSRLTDLLRGAEATLTEHALAESDTPKPREPEPQSEAKPHADSP